VAGGRGFCVGMIYTGPQSPGSFRSTLPDHDHRAMQD
jgi:hypothetical protein